MYMAIAADKTAIWREKEILQRKLDRKKEKKRKPLIGHGEILPGTPKTYADYKNDGRTLFVKTPFTPRPYDHAMSNAVGHYVATGIRPHIYQRLSNSGITLPVEMFEPRVLDL